MSDEKQPAVAGQVERRVGHQPVAFAVFADNGNIRIWSTDIEPVRKLASDEGLPLVPLYEMPDGWQMAPTTLVTTMQAILDDEEDGRGYTHMDDELAYMARAAMALLMPN